MDLAKSKQALTICGGLRLKVWALNLGPYPFSFPLGGLESMGPDWNVVYSW